MPSAKPSVIAPTSPETGLPALHRYPRIPAGGAPGAMVHRANRWRDTYNPLRGLVLSRVVALLEEGERGEYPDLQWLYRFVEKRDPILRAIIKRRRAALQKLEWEIKVVSELPDGATPAMAESQRKTLRSAYDAIDNLREAIAHLATAEFRGYAHVQKHYADGSVRHLECIPQWNWVRDGSLGPWYYTQDAQPISASAAATRNDAVIDPIDWLIREEDMPIDEIAAVIFVRKGLSQKDWDAFVEIFGLPGCIVIGPPGVQPGSQDTYKDAAETVAQGGSGYLPNGADAKFPSEVRGQNPFKEHLDQQNSDLVIAGTGGKLTILNEATGLGSGNSEVHDDAFDDLAVEEASVISEIFQKQFDCHVLAKAHAGQPILAYFELSAADKKDLKEFAENYGIAVRSGLVTPNIEDEKQFREMTALPAMSSEVVKAWKANPTREPITIQDDSASGGLGQPGQRPPGLKPGAPSKPDPAAPTAPAAPVTPVANRGTTAAAVQRLAEAFAADLQPIRLRLERILAIEDESILRARLEAFRAELPNLLRDINADPAAAGTIEDILRTAFAAGVDRKIP